MELDARRTASAFIVGAQGGVQVLRLTGSVDDLEAVLDTLVDYLRGPGTPALCADQLRRHRGLACLTVGRPDGAR